MAKLLGDAIKLSHLKCLLRLTIIFGGEVTNIYYQAGIVNNQLDDYKQFDEVRCKNYDFNDDFVDDFFENEEDTEANRVVAAMVAYN